MKTTINNLLMFMAIFMFLVGCELTNKNSPMDKMNDKEIKQYFIDHKNDLEKIVKICKQNPKIRFMDKTIEGSSFYENTYDISKQTLQTQQELKKAIGIINQIKLDNVHCVYLYEQPDIPIFARVSFTVYSAGLLVGGEGQSIEYETKIFREKYKKYLKEPNYIEVSLPYEGWFILTPRK